MLKIIKNCVDCGKLIDFENFCKLNPSLDNKTALDLWENPLISIYCPGCFFHRPEKPFKVKRRDFTYIKSQL